jgi:autotransporter-associated beta strand protein
VTASGTGPKTLALYTGNNGNGDREAIIFTGGIANSSDAISATSVTVTFNTQGSSNWVSLNGVNTFTGPITLAQINGTANGVLVVGGVRAAQSGANTIGSGSLGSGNYAGTITLGARTVLEYDSTATQTLSGVISGAGAMQLTGNGPVTLSGANTYSGNTTVNSGCSLVLAPAGIDPAGSMNFVVTNATANKITGGGTATLNGIFTIDTSAVTAFVGSWALVDVTTKTYGGSFGVTGFTGPVGTVFTKEDGDGVRTWTFDTTTGALSVTAKALITSFGALGKTGVIDQVAKTIALDVPNGTDLATLAPTFVTSSGTCDQTSGSPPSPTFDSANPATYTVTDVSASVTNPYTVTVTVAPVPPGGVGGGLNAWYDASVGVTTSGSNVTAWKDQSGNGYHATLGAGTPQLGTSQINGLPAVFFRGGNNYLNINHNIVPQQEYIVFRSGRYAYDPGNPNLWGSDWGGPFGQQNDNGWMLEGGTKKMWGDGSRIPLAVSQNGTSIVQDNANGNPYGMANVANYMILKVNPRNFGSAYGRIGRPNNSWGNGYMDVAEIIVYNRILTSEEENAVGYYLATKYGVSSTYVNPNPTAPEKLNAIAGDSVVSLTWATYLGATSYNVKRSETLGGPYTTVGTPTETSFTDSPLANGTPYYYVVSAVAGSESPDSTEVTATPTGVDATLSTVVSSPSLLWADGVASSTITVTLLNSSSTPVANKTVSLAQTSGSGATINTVSDTTGVDGKAIFTVTSTTAGTCVLTATDVTDSNLVIEDTATVEFAAATTMAINVDIDNTVRSGLNGPIGGLGTVWNTKATSSATNLLHASGPPTTVGYTSTNLGGPDEWGTPSLVMLQQGLRNFDTSPTNSQQLVINGLSSETTYDLYIASANIGGQRHNGVWSTTNTTTTPGDHPCGNTDIANGSTWVEGNNYVVFRAVVPDGSGRITVNGRSIAVPGFDCRLPMSGFQLVESSGSGPTYADWAALHAGGAEAPANGDYNNDGVQNGVAFFMGMDDLATNPGVVDGSVTWPHINTVTSYKVQTSIDLSPTGWTDVLTGDPRLHDTGLGGSVSYDLLPAEQGTLFVRLVVIP